MTKELEGFTLFKPPLKNEIHISIRKRCIGISIDACEALGSKWINVFFDERKKRMMVKRAEEGYKNTLKISDNGESGRTINSAGVCETLKRMFGDRAKIGGHVAGDGIIIFDEVR